MEVPQDPSKLPHENEGPNILGATLTVTIVALLTLAVRLYVRLKMIRNVGWDVSTHGPIRIEDDPSANSLQDYVMVFAMALVR
jgi:hypothetical protein